MYFQHEFLECQLDQCPNKKCAVDFAAHIPAILNKLTLLIREHIKKYYEVRTSCTKINLTINIREYMYLYRW